MWKISTLPTKTPIATDFVTGIDSIDWNTATQNKNFLFSAIATFIFWSKTTTNLAEWTNQYYTEAKVTANATVVWLWSSKADKTNVIEKDSTTAYTPTLATHPATKEYVDSSWVNINGQTSQPAIVSWDQFIYYDVSATANRKISYLDVENKVLSSIVFPWSSVTYYNSAWGDSTTTSASFATVKSFTATKDWSYLVWYTATNTWWVWSETRVLVGGVQYLYIPNFSEGGSGSITWLVVAWKWAVIEFQAKARFWNTVTVLLTTVKWDR